MDKAELLKRIKDRQEKEKEAREQIAQAKKKSTPKRTKSKKVSFQIGNAFSREQRIKACERCGGNPPPVSFVVNEFEGERCAHDDCMEIISYRPRSK